MKYEIRRDRDGQHVLIDVRSDKVIVGDRRVIKFLLDHVSHGENETKAIKVATGGYARV
jgi:hypothetical protein